MRPRIAKALGLSADELGDILADMSRVKESVDREAAVLLVKEDSRDVEALLMAAADESATFLEWTEASNVSDLTVDQIQSEIRSEIRRVARRYLRAPTIPLFERTRALRERIAILLEGHQKPSLSRELYSAAGWSLTVLAWISTDLGSPETAEDHLRAAWGCAGHADQNNLKAWIRAAQHTAAFWQNDFANAAQYAEDGLQYATNGSSALFLASAWALDLARLGDRDRAESALLDARRFADNVDSRMDELAGPFTCSIGRAGGFWSDTYLALGEPREALDLANEAVAACESMPAETRNLGSERMVRCQQVKGYLISGEYDGAYNALLPILDTAPECRVRPLVHRFGEISELANGLNANKVPELRQVHDATIAFCES